MNEFGLLAKRDAWITVNHLRDIKRDPKRLVIYLLYLFWLGSIVFNVVLRYRNPGEVPLELGPQIVGAGFFGLGTVLVLYFVYRGTVESSTFFTMGDVHLLFPAPVSPKKVLLYSMIKQTLLYFFLYGIFVPGFMPLLTNIVRVNLEYLHFMYFGYIGLLLAIGPLNFLVFAAGSKYGLHLRLQQGIVGLAAIFVIYLAGNVFYAGDILDGILAALNVPFLDYIPIVGWSRAAFMTAVSGYSSFSLAAVLLQLLFLAGCIVFSYAIADDYYEDTLKATEKRSLRTKQREGAKKTRRLAVPWKAKQKLVVRKAGSGPWALFWRSKVEYSRSDLHPYLSFWSIIFLAGGIVIGLFGPKYSSGLTPVYFANAVAAYIIFIVASAESGSHELTKPYIYLIPGSPLLKIITSNLSDLLRMTVNALLLNIALGILLDASIQTILVMVVFMVSFYALNLSSGFFIRIIFPSAVDQKTLYPLFLMLQIVLLLVPGAIVGGILAYVFQSVLLAFLGISLANIIIVAVLFLLSNAVFVRLEWK